MTFEYETELALHIIRLYPYLINERDESSMTSLQYLACNQTAFRRKEMVQIKGGVIEKLNKSTIEKKRGVLQQAFADHFFLHSMSYLTPHYHNVCLIYSFTLICILFKMIFFFKLGM